MPATGPSLNETMLPNNTCFGCGVKNPKGLGARFYRDPERADRLVGELVVPEHAGGLPGIAQGGAIYTALDCLAGWVPFVLKAKRKMIPIGRSSTITYHRPVRVGERVTLSGTIAREGPAPTDPLVVHSEMRNAAGDLVADGDFKVILLPPAQFKRVVGIAELPEDYRKFYGEV